MKHVSPLALLVGLVCFLAPPAIGETNTNRYPCRGVVEKLAPDLRQATIHHQAIPGYMMEMTMDFQVKNTNELSGLTRGDAVVFTLVIDGNSDWIENVRRVGRGVVSTVSQPASAPAELRPGDPVPDLELVTEEGHHARLADFRGRALAFTFFFTRCPLPDYCPRMNRNFAEARKFLLAATNAPSNWQLLSVSFDAEFDKPEVLSQHAGFYRGNDPRHWLFAAASPRELAKVAPGLNLLVSREGGNISHNLRTVVLDPRGRICRLFDGNQWTPQQLADALLAAGRSGNADEVRR